MNSTFEPYVCKLVVKELTDGSYRGPFHKFVCSSSFWNFEVYGLNRGEVYAEGRGIVLAALAHRPSPPECVQFEAVETEDV